MKIEGLEGSTQEIHDFFQNNGLEVSDYFQVPQKPISWLWIIVLGALVLVGQILLVLELGAEAKISKLLFITTCFFIICWAMAIQVKFENSWATSLVAIGGLLLSLVSFGVFSPEQIVDVVQQLKSD